MPAFQEHFREIAPRYSALRGLDARAVRRIARRIAQLGASGGGGGGGGGGGRLALLDVGTGSGRYLDAVTAELDARNVAISSATGVDASRHMLDSLRATFPRGRAAGALADALPFPAGSFDVAMSFNALHHFPSFDAFLAEVTRVLKPGGLLVLYTRTPEQNRLTVWGQHFPGFAERETRLYTRPQLRDALGRVSALGLVTLRVAAWWQWTTLPGLVRQARRRHYSTFRYYSEPQFAAALAAFQRRIRGCYPCPWAIPVRNNHLIAFGVRRA